MLSFLTWLLFKIHGFYFGPFDGLAYLRLKGPERKKKKGEKQREMAHLRAQRDLVYESAAEAWGSGVPWAQALSMAERAAGQAMKKKALPKGKAKAKAGAR